MYDREEFMCTSNSKDIRLVVAEIQRKGELLMYNQGTISVAMQVFYRMVYALGNKEKAQKIDSLGSLLVGVLNIAEKTTGTFRKISRVVINSHLVSGFALRNEGVHRIFLHEKEIIQFVWPHRNMYKEVSAQSLLQTEVVICSLLRFDFFFTDLHCVLWRRLKKKKHPESVLSTAWIILTDALSYPFLEYFSHNPLLQAVEAVALRVEKWEHEKAPCKDPEQVQMIESEILRIYVNNCKATIFALSTENTLGLFQESAFESAGAHPQSRE
ncbi:uncharacterized protein NEMAJ01_0693 [Nematocida major]|uniref:uncharacterized protein n=1 Tax=Nematocida major TaxID=1912982 RepID=UPI002007CCB0|nr:uncharacterized protein NEMAJ01_0693 [Nematocida major]KAH9385797.1 hypothetical protein NEMAJ01_0693 [Nematocida major]